MHGKVKLLERRIMAAKGPAPMSTRGEFLVFYKDWLKFREAKKGWAARGWGGVMDQVRDYKKRTNIWVSRAAKLGVISAKEAIPVGKPIPWGNITLGLGLLLGFILYQKTKG